MAYAMEIALCDFFPTNITILDKFDQSSLYEFLKSQERNARNHSIKAVSNDIENQFELFYRIWEKDTIYVSSVSEIIEHPEFQKILELGTDAVPYILQKISQNPSMLVIALPIITEENPVQDGHEYNINEIINDWIVWGKKKGI